MTCLTSVQLNSDPMSSYYKYLYGKVHQLAATPVNDVQWNKAYTELHAFLSSDSHNDMTRRLFGAQQLSKEQAKFSSKLVFWLMDKYIHFRTENIIHSQLDKVSEQELHL